VVLDVAGARLPNAQVNFSTTAGTLSATQVTTDGNGEAQVTLTTNAAATVTARAGTASATFAVTVGSSVALSVNPSSGTIATVFTFTVTPALGAQSVILDFGDGNSVSLGAITSATTATHTYSSTGSMTARVTQSGSGGSSSAVVVVTVN
jgi:PKD repeat protein